MRLRCGIVVHVLGVMLGPMAACACAGTDPAGPGSARPEEQQGATAGSTADTPVVPMQAAVADDANGVVTATPHGAESAVGAPLDPGFKPIHRLNTVEYNVTIADVLGTRLQPATANWRGGELAGFDNMAAVLGIDEAQYQRYFDAAQTLATEVFSSARLREAFVSCEASQMDCVRASIETMGLRLFRRPLTTQELATYLRVYEAALELGDEPSAGLEQSFRAMLSSAEFLFRIEYDAQPDSVEPHALSSFELASRLSYFLWSSAPDEELLELAVDGDLQDPETLSGVVDRMLDDPKSERMISNFSGQWLGARQVVAHPVAPQFYNWSPEVARAAQDEMVLYFAEFVRTERSWFEFPLADVNFIDGWLSRLYGMPTPLNSHERVEFDEDERAGFFGLAGFLALTSFDRRTSPSLRGRWIATNFLCVEMPDPPPDVPELVEGQDATALNVRQALELHRQDPVCAACHGLFDAYGLALEEYDAIGQFRTEYPDGTVVDASGVLPVSTDLPDGQSIEGLDGLARAVANDPRFGQCLAKKLLTYGLGRVATAADEPHLDQVQHAWLAQDEVPSIRRLIRTLALSEPFRYRRGDGDSGEPL